MSFSDWKGWIFIWGKYSQNSDNTWNYFRHFQLTVILSSHYNQTFRRPQNVPYSLEALPPSLWRGILTQTGEPRCQSHTLLATLSRQYLHLLQRNHSVYYEPIQNCLKTPCPFHKKKDIVFYQLSSSKSVVLQKDKNRWHTLIRSQLHVLQQDCLKVVQAPLLQWKDKR